MKVDKPDNIVHVIVDIRESQEIIQYIAALQAEIKYLRAMLEIADPELLFNQN